MPKLPSREKQYFLRKIFDFTRRILKLIVMVHLDESPGYHSSASEVHSVLPVGSTTRALHYEQPLVTSRSNEPTTVIPDQFRSEALSVLTNMRNQLGTGVEFLESEEVAVRELWQRSSPDTQAAFLSQNLPTGIRETLWTTVIAMRRAIFATS